MPCPFGHSGSNAGVGEAAAEPLQSSGSCADGQRSVRDCQKPLQSVAHGAHQAHGHGACEFDQICLVDRCYLGRIGYRILGEARLTLGKERIARRSCERLVAREHADNNRSKIAAIDLIALQYKRRVAVGRFRAARLPEIDPPDLSSLD